MFVDEKGNFKKTKDYSESEIKIAGNIVRFAILMVYKDGIPSPANLHKKMKKILPILDITKEDVQEVVAVLVSESMKITFNKDVEQIGFTTQNTKEKKTN